MRIPENTIEEIRSSANIVDVISSYVALRKRGKNFIGLCPFHQEKTPSFTVSDEKQIFHCFGCHAGGNVYKFLMDYKSISFVEAVQEIAESV
ncbi:MAG: DNA primase, partial [Ignavibacteriae bacterium]|nr:DNA primase [Ignavibacteriota bacterium]